MSGCEQLTDQELLLLLQENNHNAFTEIYNRFKGVLLLHAYNKLDNRDEARDIVQELFTNLWNNRHKLAIENLSAYLYTTIRNAAIKVINRKKFEKNYLDTLNEVVTANAVPADYLVREKQLSAIIEDAVSQLPEKMREIFIMSRKLNMSHREISEELGIAEPTVKKQVSNALRILRTKLGLWVFLIMLIKY